MNVYHVEIWGRFTSCANVFVAAKSSKTAKNLAIKEMQEISPYSFDEKHIDSTVRKISNTAYGGKTPKVLAAGYYIG